MNYFMMPNYFIISENEIAHFIHYLNLIRSEDKSAIQDIIIRKILKIYSIYIKYMQSIYIINMKNKNKNSVFL